MTDRRNAEAAYVLCFAALEKTTSIIIFLCDDVQFVVSEIIDSAEASPVAMVLTFSASSCNVGTLKSLGYRTEVDASMRLSRSEVMALMLNISATTSFLISVHFLDEVECGASSMMSSVLGATSRLAFGALTLLVAQYILRIAWEP